MNLKISRITAVLGLVLAMVFTARAALGAEAKQMTTKQVMKAAKPEPQGDQTTKRVERIIPGFAEVLRSGPASPGCGNSIVETDEECDDGNRTSYDGCSSACAWEPCYEYACGNHKCELGESRGRWRPPCPEDCVSSEFTNRTILEPTHLPRCGNGVVETPGGVLCADGRVVPGWTSGEECDDGNNIAGDGCSTRCQIEPVCGNGRVERGEGCDDGNRIDNDACTNVCRSPLCGDGIIEGGEMCDDGNAINDDACLNSCLNAACGDGIIQTGVDECDDGNRIDTDTCTNACRNAVCGDRSVHEGVEECDDGNTVTGDGCDPTCRLDAMGLCLAADGSRLPPGVAFRDYPDSRHISRCEGDERIRYIICGRGEERLITESMEVCPEGVRCVDGMCVDDRRVYTCTDIDGVDRRTRGRVEGTEDGTSYSHPDICYYGTRQVAEQICRLDNRPYWIILDCAVDELCIDGACVPRSSVPTCENACEDDDGLDVHTAQTAYATSEDCRSYTSRDSCGVDSTRRSVREYFCTIDRTLSFTDINCASTEYCLDGRCVPNVITPTCTDTEEGTSTNIRGIVTGMGRNGTTYTYADQCYYDRILEFFCETDNYLDARIIPCPDGQYCVDGICGVSCDCQRTDATATAAGFVTRRDCTLQHDICDGRQLVPYRCSATGMSEEAPRVTCPEECCNGLCVTTGTACPAR